MKRWVFSLIFILLISSMVYGATDRLVIRFHSTTEKQEIDLKQYLGYAPAYYYNITTNQATVTIDKDGIALIRGKAGFTGVETIIFSTNESMVYEKKEQKEDYTLLENLTEAIIEEYPELITYKEVEKVFEGNLVDEILLKSIRRTEIEKITSELKEDELLVNVNDEALLMVAFENQTKPKLTIALFDDEAKVDESALRPNYLNMILIGLGIILAGGLILYRDRLFTLLRSTKHRLVTRKKSLEKKLGEIRTGEDTKKVIEDVFIEKFGLNRFATPYEMENSLKKFNIRGNLKQEILFLYRKLNEEHLSNYEVQLIKRYLRKLNKKF
ncbi:MAG: hypothetical protein PHE43_04380 [Candidatus Nanoarchaeia archaeon]|nr:hypothetical protein [Candidatus Nanoarchaeia archaeon]